MWTLLLPSNTFSLTLHTSANSLWRSDWELLLLPTFLQASQCSLMDIENLLLGWHWSRWGWWLRVVWALASGMVGSLCMAPFFGDRDTVILTPNHPCTHGVVFVSEGSGMYAYGVQTLCCARAVHAALRYSPPLVLLRKLVGMLLNPALEQGEGGCKACS